MSDATTDVKDAQNDPLNGAKTPMAGLRVINDLVRESSELLGNAKVEVGTGEAQTWTTENDQRSFELSERLKAARAEYDARFAGHDSLQLEMRQADALAAGGYITPDGEPVMPEQLAPSSAALHDRLSTARGLMERYDKGDTRPLNNQRGWAEHVMSGTRNQPVMERATVIATGTSTANTAGNVAGPIPAQDYWPMPGQTAQHFQIIPKVMLGGIAYRTFVQVERVTEVAPVAQGVAAAEGNFTYLPYQGNLNRYAAFVPVTEEAMRDVMQVDDLIYNDVARDAAEKVSRGILSGSGAGDNILGITNLNATSYTARLSPVPSTVDWSYPNARAAQPTAQDRQGLIIAIADAMRQVMDTGEASPEVVTASFDAWFHYITAQDNDGRFIFRDPSTPGPMTVYGLPFRPTNEFPARANNADVALVGAWSRYSRLYWWGDVELKMGLNGTDLVQGQETILGTIHCDAFFGRPTAFCRIQYNLTT